MRASRRMRAAPEHPRIGGEDSTSSGVWAPNSGTPPRRRGRRRHAQAGRGRRRSTPASAGRTRTSPTTTPCRSEHPRVGGEDVSTVTVCESGVGAPSRRRGGPVEMDVFGREPRNTPASAGRTPTRSPRGSATTEHPRAGGEDTINLNTDTTAVGTPPRRRGRPRREWGERSRGRNTLASARKTESRQAPAWPAAEHPRVGGEDAAYIRTQSGRTGTPPRWRGRRRCCPLLLLGRRNTPASAGKTARSCGYPR